MANVSLEILTILITEQAVKNALDRIEYPPHFDWRGEVHGRMIADASFHRQRLDHANFSDVRLERCTFDNCSLGGGTLTRPQLTDCRTWACSLTDLALKDCLIDGLRTTSTGSGRRIPLFLWGVRSRYVTLRGRVVSSSLPSVRRHHRRATPPSRAESSRLDRPPRTRRSGLSARLLPWPTR